jgi:hypothetical protein
VFTYSEEISLRKLTLGALAASATLAIAATAIAQSPEATFTAKVSPKSSGTKKKPKSTSLSFRTTLDRPNTTVGFIDINLPKTLRLSGKGLKRCSVDTLASQGPSGCPTGSKAGPTGTADALLGAAGPSQSPLHFTVSPFVLNNTTLVFYVASDSGSGVAVQSPITGKITNKGRKIRITIPQELRQPVTGVDAQLTAIEQTFSGKRGKHYLVSSLGCKHKKHKLTGALEFVARADRAPVPPAQQLAASAKCKKK